MKKRKQKQKSQSKTVSFRLDMAEKQLVKKLAGKNGLSEAKFLENIIKPYIKEYSNNLSKTNKKKSLSSVSFPDIDLGAIPNQNVRKQVKFSGSLHDISLDEVSDLKLKIQLIPYKNWGNNIRKIRSKASWKLIREEQLKKFNNKCTFCGDSKRKLHCHEDWEINHENFTQRLKGLKIVCEYCHHCIHWGMMQKIDIDGTLTEKITKHFLNVNNCDKKAFFKHHNEEVTMFNKNINNNYHLDLGKYAFDFQDLPPL